MGENGDRPRERNSFVVNPNELWAQGRSRRSRIAIPFRSPTGERASATGRRRPSTVAGVDAGIFLLGLLTYVQCHL